MLRTMADRNDVRPVVLFYANKEWDGVALRPRPMRDASETALLQLGVPGDRIHTERFNMV